MATRTVGIIVNGATSRIGSTQHLRNALAPIRAEGGLAVGADRVMPRVLLVGRDADRLAALGREHGVESATDLDAALADPAYEVLFDAAVTHRRQATLEKAIAAGKHVYSEKPVAASVAAGRALVAAMEARGLRHAAVEDKQYLPGLRKLAAADRRPASSAASSASGSNSAGGCSTASRSAASGRAGTTARLAAAG